MASNNILENLREKVSVLYSTTSDSVSIAAANEWLILFERSALSPKVALHILQNFNEYESHVVFFAAHILLNKVRMYHTWKMLASAEKEEMYSTVFAFSMSCATHEQSTFSGKCFF